MKYLLIENLMGGCAWILEEYQSEQELDAAYVIYNNSSSNDSIQRYIVTEEELQQEIDKGTLDYL